MSAFDALTNIPDSFVSGEVGVAWSETLEDYSSASYSVAMNFASQTPMDGFKKFTIAGSGSGTSWTFTFPSGGSAPKPGDYLWQKIVTRTSDSATREIECGRLQILPNRSATPTTTTAQSLLAAIETTLTTLTSKTRQSVSLNGQSYTLANIGDLMRQRTDLQAEVNRELQQSGTVKINRNIQTVFA